MEDLALHWTLGYLEGHDLFRESLKVGRATSCLDPFHTGTPQCRGNLVEKPVCPSGFEALLGTSEGRVRHAGGDVHTASCEEETEESGNGVAGTVLVSFSRKDL